MCNNNVNNDIEDNNNSYHSKGTYSAVGAVLHFQCKSSSRSVTYRCDTDVPKGELSCLMSHILEAEGQDASSRLLTSR